MMATIYLPEFMGKNTISGKINVYRWAAHLKRTISYILSSIGGEKFT